jgi:YhcH/YjgK/YiaL family protein
MIFDKLKNTGLYYKISDKIKEAFEYLEKTDLKNIENGKYEINGDDIFVIIQEYQTKHPEEGKWEAHKKYTDIQYIISGEESLGCLNIDEFITDSDYDEEKDIVFGTGKGSFVTAKEGFFVIFTPEDAHMPSVCVTNPSYVKKAVVKVRV